MARHLRPARVRPEPSQDGVPRRGQILTYRPGASPLRAVARIPEETAVACVDRPTLSWPAEQCAAGQAGSASAENASPRSRSQQLVGA